MFDPTTEATASPELRQSLLALVEKHSVPVVDLAALTLVLEDLALLPFEVARRHAVLPLLVKDDALFLAMATPDDRRAVDEVEFVSGKKVVPFACDAEQLAATLDLAYERLAQGERTWVGPRAGPVSAAPVGEAPVVPATPTTPEPPPMPMPRAAPPVLKSRSATLVPGLVTVPAARVPPPADVKIPPPPPLPAARTQTRPKPEAPVPSSVPPSAVPSVLPPMLSPTGRTVALVLADEGMRETLRAAFVDLGHAVAEPSPNEARSALLAHRPDLAVIDLGLADGLGLALCAELHAARETQAIPVLALLGEAQTWRHVEDLRAACGVRGVLGRPLRAVDVLTRAEAIFDTKPEALLEDFLPPQAEVSLQSGVEAYQRGEVEEALRFLEQGLRAAPGSFRLHYHHGLLLGRTGAVHRAVRAFEQSLALNDRYFPALRNLAVLYERMGFRRCALEAWERAHIAAADEETRQHIKERVLFLL